MGCIDLKQLMGLIRQKLRGQGAKSKGDDTWSTSSGSGLDNDSASAKTKTAALQASLLQVVPANLVATSLSNPLFYKQQDVKEYNLNVPVHPIAITYPHATEQVQAIVKCAAKHKVNVQARSGGHGYANYAYGGGDLNTLVVDLKNIQQVHVDQATWLAKIGASALLGDITQELIKQGNRAFAHGICPQVGIGGHATIGGLGPASRMWGAALDHIHALTVVKADGSVVRASLDSNPDLFWAMRGAGASFGIVTEFEIVTRAPPSQAIAYEYAFNARPFVRHCAQPLKNWMRMVADPMLSERLASEVYFTEAGMVVTGMFYGTEAEFAVLHLQDVFPRATSAKTLVFNQWAGAMAHWFENVALHLGGGLATHFYAKSAVFTPADVMSDEAVDGMLEFLDTTEKGSLLWFGIFDLSGGQTSKIAPDATAFAHRNALFYFQPYVVDPFQPINETSRKFLDQWLSLLQQASPGIRQNGNYPGYVDPELGGAPDAQLAYWGANYARLQMVKATYDENDMFHNPQSVPLPVKWKSPLR